MKAIKLCPWCGKLPVLIVDNEDAPQKYAYFCDGGSDKEDNHYAYTGWHSSKEKAREEWNKRACDGVVWNYPHILPEVGGDFIDEIIIEYENDLGIFHAIGLFFMAEDTPVFLEVLTGTKIDWNKTVKRWRFYK